MQHVVTDQAIVALRAQAGAANDLDQVLVCDLALGVTDFGAMAPEMTQAEAREECGRVLADAEASKPWGAYRLTIRVGRRHLEWTRYAPNPTALVVATQEVCAREWPGRDDVKIVGWEAAS
ncbi:MAG: hypothetical protein ACYC2H_01420 [Thermoplasmatota archaeon]